MEKKYQIFVYGAYGFTGKLICNYLKDKFDGRYKIIIGGRDKEKTENLAEKLGFDCVVADVSEQKKLNDILSQTFLLINCAGPFKYTANFFMNSCIENKCNYIDITGEKDIFILGKSLDEKAKKAGIIIMPGTGFDVVPTDCMSLFLKNKLPKATHLELAFKGMGSLSRGTALTAAEGLNEPSYIRENGVLKPINIGTISKSINFGDKKPLHCIAIPWGDVVTAFYTTSIPNIKVFVPVPKSVADKLKLSNYLPSFLKTAFAYFLKKYIHKNIKGPSENTLKNGFTIVYGKAHNETESIEAFLKTPDGYQLTMLSSVYIADKIINENFNFGYQTPAGLFGENLILDIIGNNASFEIVT
jgi:short subunit dehydrogenase-like uncharacterized protein